MASDALIQQGVCPENTDTYLPIVAYLYLTLSLQAFASCRQHRRFVLSEAECPSRPAMKCPVGSPLKGAFGLFSARQENMKSP